MLGLQYAGTVIDHWKEHFPTKYRRLKAAGTVDAEAQKISRDAAQQVADLMEQGFSKHQAEEFVLPDLVYPKPGADEA